MVQNLGGNEYFSILDFLKSEGKTCICEIILIDVIILYIIACHWKMAHKIDIVLIKSQGLHLCILHKVDINMINTTGLEN